MWIDIASIVFVCVTANHLGLIGKLEEIMGELPIIDCPKCSAFWSTLTYGLWSFGFSEIPLLLAISFLASYIALWLELLEAYIDTLYMKLYGKITETDTDDTVAADDDGGHPESSVSELSETYKET